MTEMFGRFPDDEIPTTTNNLDDMRNQNRKKLCQLDS